MATAELQLLLRRGATEPGLISVGWYLHGVASVDEARERYTLARQRQAFLVSAHIFDLALNQDTLTSEQRLSFGFAAAIGYRRGGRDPNATAIMNRLRSDINIESPAVDHIGTLSLEAGLAFLGFQTKTLFRWLGTWRRQLAALARDAQLPDLTTTAFGPTQFVILGAEDLLTYFARGNTDRLQRGLTRLRSVAIGESGPGDLNSRWVAAHLLNLAGEAQAGSLWNPKVLPPTVPPLVRQAFTIGNPPVLTLWEPQRELLTGTPSPFSPDVRRMVLAVPTSGGKTLLAQMLAVDHLSRTDRSVCYIAPTRSLGREVRKAMAGRVRILEKETGDDRPDFPGIWELLDIVTIPEIPADVEVMTPERLNHLLRHDVEGVLNRFGMFIFDEAQLLKESGRGFVFESVIASLNYLTRDTDHQIVLISAAMGNAGAIAQWLGPDERSLLHQSEWRGPRRLDAVFTTDADWATTRIEGNTGRTWRFRHTTDLRGRIRVRTADGRIDQLSTTGDTGWHLVRKSKDGKKYSNQTKKDNSRSTPNYVIASDMIVELGHAGSVLVVATTRRQAQQLALALAKNCDEKPSLAPLVNFTREQLGENHPLVAVLRRGVGFHHAGLPIEILEALEQAVRDDTLPYLTCTSTLTDGVNLPVRTVVLYDQSYEGQADDSLLRGARIVNAIGRAGRAGKETEGWVVLVRGASPTPSDFEDLNPGTDELAVTSSLTTADALEALAQCQARLRSNEDALFTETNAAADFISFVWLMLAIEENRDVDPASADIDQIVGATLAATQSADARQICTQIADVTRRKYVQSAPDARRRWVRPGTSLGSARTIDRIATQLIDVILSIVSGAELLRNPEPLLRSMSTIVVDLLKLPEAPPWRFRVTVRGAEIDVNPVDLLVGWISGQSLPALADMHLAAAPDPTWRIEQMVDAVTSQFEHFLAWSVGALVELVNAGLSDADSDRSLCPELGGYIRYGVNNQRALLLMTSGIRSRRLAHAITRDISDDVASTSEDLRTWLSAMSITEWRDRFSASPSELLDLLEFTRLRSRSLLRSLLENGTVAVNLRPVADAAVDPTLPLSLEATRDEPSPQPLALYAGDTVIAQIVAEDHIDVQAILDTGLELALELDGRDESSLLRISLPASDTDT
ncbi:DEAD/DEAH box helicase [Nocardia aobensis]|uniref:DEAD/DEAH box helicase n=1 Tax=Nocardia aobensis TaxID=257277 RepID=A0ABW6NYU2_9NOCA